MRIKKRFLGIVLFSVIISTANAQEDYKGVDEHALATTRKVGVVNISASVMSVPASDAAINHFMKRIPEKRYYVFPEKRENPIELLDNIPEIWTKREKKDFASFNGQVAAGEFYTFQLGIFAHEIGIENLRYSSKGLKALTCFNLEGVDYEGNSFVKNLDVAKGKIQPLWFGLQIPQDAKEVIEGEVVLRADNAPDRKIKIHLTVSNDKVNNYGYDEDGRLSRLAWLNSKIAQDESVVKGYTPVRIEGETISLLGRQIVLGASGLPKAIHSFFDAGNMKLNNDSEPILADDIKFIIEKSDGQHLQLEPQKIKFTHHSPAKACWQVEHRSSILNLVLKGQIESEGILKYEIAINAKQNIDIKDIRLEVPMKRNKSEYMMGMGREGGFRPDEWSWKWNVDYSQDMVWVGGINGGLSLKLKGANYQKQLVNIYYVYGKLNLPESWGNEYRGGCVVKNVGENTLVNAYSGKRLLKKGDRLDYNFEMCITPFKLIDKVKQFEKRYYHNGGSDLVDNYVNEAVGSGAQIINIHHCKDIYPFINYPYFSCDTPFQKEFIDKAHKSDQKVCFYYTTRELTINTPEIWTMRSLGHEIIFPGSGSGIKTVVNPNGAHPWLQDRFKNNFIPAWKCTLRKGRYANAQDLSVITTPDSRLDNFYLEGLDWMCKNLNLDGIYVDDTALGATSMRRARKILDKNRPEAFINMHIWNNFREKGFYGNGINQYMELLPFLDHLWIGEGRSYDTKPDYWLVEISGIPFGVPSQMLNQGGNRWRGMVFGMTNRSGYYGPTPEYIWKFWDENKFSKMDMLGFWNKETPVRTDNSNLYATVYKSDHKAIIAIANWGEESHSGKLYIDWPKLGLDPERVKVTKPFIKEFQEQEIIDINTEIKIEAKKGCLIYLSY